MSHNPAILIYDGRSVPAYLCDGAPDSLYLFVHGFGGSPKTWRNIDPIAISSSGLGSADVFLWSYDSVAQSVHSSAQELNQFIRQVFPRFKSSDFGGDATDIRDYRRIVLVAHSLGGVVIRRGVNLAAKTELLRGEPYMYQDAHLRLVSPALGGVRLARFKGAIQAVFGSIAAVSIWLGMSPSYKELLPNSPVLSDLASQTERFAEDYPDQRAFRAHIVWAEREDVVSERDYQADLPLGLIEGTTHKTVPYFREDGSSILNFIVS
jgi:pimeloyl-ACP methyl ester carboxylesterase